VHLGVHVASFFLALADALQTAQVNQDVDQVIEVGDSLAIAQFRALDAQFDSLRIDPFVGPCVAREPAS